MYGIINISNKKGNTMSKRQFVSILLGVCLLLTVLTACGGNTRSATEAAPNGCVTEAETTEEIQPTENATEMPTTEAPEPAVSLPETNDATFSLGDVPTFSDTPYVELNGNYPFFTAADCTTDSFEYYSALDDLGRCGTAFACLGTELMPTEERGSIGNVRPTGWQLDKYDFVDGKYLYNRCHLIGFQLAGENANEMNLITGTRYMNIYGMEPFENEIAGYLRRTGNHVLYRVTPEYEGENLVATGVRMEAYSVEDDGQGICFHVFCYNCQPQVTINYDDGTSCLTDTLTHTQTPETEAISAPTASYVLNTNTMKFHDPGCSSVADIKEKNRQDVEMSRDEIIAAGFSPCGRCDP